MNKMYRLTNSVDGVERLTIVVRNRLSLDELANYVAVSMQGEGVSRDGEVAHGVIEEELPNKRAAIKLATSVIYTEGYESPQHAVSGYNLDDLQAVILKRLEELWGVGS